MAIGGSFAAKRQVSTEASQLHSQKSPFVRVRSGDAGLPFAISIVHSIDPQPPPVPSGEVCRGYYWQPHFLIATRTARWFVRWSASVSRALSRFLQARDFALQ